MKILIAEDDSISRRILQTLLQKWGYEVVVTADGAEAWDILSQDDSPRIAILDWMMPKMDGVSVCRMVRERWERGYIYIIILTGKDQKEDIVTALNAGADDYVNKPFDQEELKSRIRAGIRIVQLEVDLSMKIAALQEALNHVKHLQGLLPICAYCKKVRDDKNYWHQVEDYVTNKSEVVFSHSICPECYVKYAKPDLDEWKRQKLQGQTEQNAVAVPEHLNE
jgi:sigma-B regulation protein RsbU (phosphoserine phosphatase)